MLEGTPITESLRHRHRTRPVHADRWQDPRYLPGGVTEDQPAIWSSIDSEIADSEGEALASALAAGLGERGWYANVQSATEAYAVFAGQVFRYPRGGPGPGPEPAAGRRRARTAAVVLRC